MKGRGGSDPLEELYFRKTVRRHVQEFSCVLSLVMLVIGGLRAWRHDQVSLAADLLCASLVVLYVGYRRPALLRPIWKGWMTFAEKLGLVMSTIILSIAWCIALMPIALMVRLFRTKVIDLSFDRAIESYWDSRDPKYDNFELLKRQF